MIGNLPQVDQLNALLRQVQLRHGVVSSNIANVNTPGYKAKEIQFEDLLKAVDGQAQGNVVEVPGLVSRQDGNNVDIDRELANLNRNSIEFQTIAQVIGSQMALYRTAITGQT